MTGDEFAPLLERFHALGGIRRRRALRQPFHRRRRLLRLHLRPASRPRRHRAYDAEPVSPRRRRLSLGNVRSGVRRRHGLCVVAVELHLDDPAIRGPARRDRRHEPLHRARRADRRVPRIRQRRRRDGAARRRAGRGWPKCSSAGPDGSRSGRKRWTIWRGRRFARSGETSINNTSSDDTTQGDRRDLSAYSLRGERQDRDHHAQPARPHECVDARSWSATCATRWRRRPPTTMSASSCSPAPGARSAPAPTWRR